MKLKFLFFACCLLVLSIPSDQSLLPNPGRAGRTRYFLDQRDFAPLSVNGNEQRLSRYENTRVRKSRDHLGDLRNYYIHRLPESEYDANGMLFLSFPRNLRDRQLNTLMNKVVDYGMAKRNGLRQTPKVKFTKKEMDRLKLIMRSFEKEKEEPVKVEERKKVAQSASDVYMNFNDLVL